MRVRHKHTGVVTEVIGFVPAHEYEIVRGEVPVDRWEDVTGGCDIDDLDIHHKGQLIWSQRPVYRLRKVQLYKVSPGSYLENCNLADKVEAFIVERKIPE